MLRIDLIHSILIVSLSLHEQCCESGSHPSEESCVIQRKQCYDGGGFQCNDQKTCITTEDWCVPNPRGFCPTQENGKFSSCLAVTFERKFLDTTYEYLFMFAHTRWATARKYCHEKGYHLISFENPKDFEQTLMHLIDLQAINTAGKNCSKTFWIGLHFNQNSKLPEYTDGTIISHISHLHDKSRNRNFTRMLQALRLHNHMIFSPTKLDYASRLSTANIACKRPKFHANHDTKFRKPKNEKQTKSRPRIANKDERKSKFSALQSNSRLKLDSIHLPLEDCISGAACETSPSRCLRNEPELWLNDGSRWWESNEIMDGNFNCPGGEDENTVKVTVSSALSYRLSPYRRLHLFNQRSRSILQAKTVCEVNGYQLLRITPETNLDQISKLMTVFRAHQEPHDAFLGDKAYALPAHIPNPGQGTNLNRPHSGSPIRFRLRNLADFTRGRNLTQSTRKKSEKTGYFKTRDQKPEKELYLIFSTADGLFHRFEDVKNSMLLPMLIACEEDLVRSGCVSDRLVVSKSRCILGTFLSNAFLMKLINSLSIF